MSPWIVLAIGINSVLVLTFVFLALRWRPGATSIALGLQGTSNVIQFGEYLTIGGVQSLLIMALLFVAGPAWSAWWTARHARHVT
jgi:hypothetical protein